MTKLLLTSVLLATVLLPVSAAWDPNPVAGLRRTLRRAAVAFVLYEFALLVIYPRI